MKKSKHDSLVDLIFNQPGKFIDFFGQPIIGKSKEFQMYNQTTDIYVAPDIVLMTPEMHYFVEIKSSNSQHCIEKAKLQMNRTEKWLREYYNFDNNMLVTLLPKFNDLIMAPEYINAQYKPVKRFR